MYESIIIRVPNEANIEPRINRIGLICMDEIEFDKIENALKFGEPIKYFGNKMKSNSLLNAYGIFIFLGML